MHSYNKVQSDLINVLFLTVAQVSHSDVSTAGIEGETGQTTEHADRCVFVHVSQQEGLSPGADETNGHWDV